MEPNFLPALITVTGALAVSLITLTFTHWSKSREDRLKRKQEMYDKLLRPYIAIFHEMLAETQNVPPLTQRKVGEIVELAFILPMYVPDRVFRAFQQVQQKANTFRSASESERAKALAEYYLALGNLVLQVRKDLGYKLTSLKGIDIIRNVIHDIDDHAKRYGL
jgi:hypothetical protein